MKTFILFFCTTTFSISPNNIFSEITSIVISKDKKIEAYKRNIIEKTGIKNDLAWQSKKISDKPISFYYKTLAMIILCVTHLIILITRLIWKIEKERTFMHNVMNNPDVSEFSIGPKGSLHAKKKDGDKKNELSGNECKG